MKQSLDGVEEPDTEAVTPAGAALGDSVEDAALGDGGEDAALGDGIEGATLGDGGEDAALGDAEGVGTEDVEGTFATPG